MWVIYQNHTEFCTSTLRISQTNLWEAIMEQYLYHKCFPALTDRRKPGLKKSGLEIRTGAAVFIYMAHCRIECLGGKIQPWKSHLAPFGGFSAPESQKKMFLS